MKLELARLHEVVLSLVTAVAPCVVATCLSCGPANSPAREPKEAAFREVATESGSFSFAWRSAPDPIPLNEPFELELRVLRAGEAVRDLEVYPAADMPAHGHGMLRLPRTDEVGEGHYRVRGMLMHMPGHWLVSIELLAGELEDRVEFSIDL